MTSETPTEMPPWEPPFAGTEIEQLLGALDRQRATFRYKADGRGRAGLTTTVGASTMTLGGLLKHLAIVEDAYSGVKLSGTTLGDPGDSDGGDGGADLEWSSAHEDEPARLYELYDDNVARARERYAVALAAGGLDQRVHLGSENGLRVSLRRLLLDLLEEYARHTGHADLLSEAVDGRTGEDPPPDWVPVGAVDDGEGHEPAVPVFEQRRMLGAKFHMVDLTGAEFVHVDLDGARIRNANLARMTITGSELYETRIEAELKDVVVNGVDIGPLVESELNRRDPDRGLVHPVGRPRDLEDIRRGWDVVERRWATAVERARALDPGLLHESVEGEWSFLETLRHLAFATEAWVGRGILGDPTPWHRLSLPWDEAPDLPGVIRDREVRPSLEEVLALRTDRQAMVRGVLADLTPARLDEQRTAPDEVGWPRGSHSARECLGVVLNEEWEHRTYAERDLAVLEAR